MERTATDDERGDPLLELDGMEHRLHDPARGEEFAVRVTQAVRIYAGDVVALMGPSGCGKTTLLSILGLLRRPSSPEKIGAFRVWPEAGRAIDLKQAWTRRDAGLIEEVRRRHVGFALQGGELVPSLTVRENIALPMRLNGRSGPECRARVDDLLTAFQLDRPGKAGATPLADSRVNRLSGGEYQRASLARAIAHRPLLVFVDEPTAALNRELAWEALAQLRALQATPGSRSATVMITHDEDLARAFAQRTIRMEPVRGEPAGQVVDISDRPPADSSVELVFDQNCPPTA